MNLAIFVIRLYQFFDSAKRTILYSAFGYQSVCKHRPTCSQYTIREIQKSGTITGLKRGLWRFLWCW